jgi:hypothetical protein
LNSSHSVEVDGSKYIPEAQSRAEGITADEAEILHFLRDSVWMGRVTRDGNLVIEQRGGREAISFTPQSTGWVSHRSHSGEVSTVWSIGTIEERPQGHDWGRVYFGESKPKPNHPTQATVKKGTRLRAIKPSVDEHIKGARVGDVVRVICPYSGADIHAEYEADHEVHVIQPHEFENWEVIE